MNSSDVQNIAHELVEKSLVTCVLVGTADPATTEFFGWTGEPEVQVTPQSLFDLASVTKPWAATLAMVLDGSGDLPLTTTVGEIWQRADSRLAKRTLESLLRHRSGLLPWTPLELQCESADDARELLLSDRLLGAPADTYSDLGYMLWGWSVERCLDRPLIELWNERLAGPLELTELCASPGPRAAVLECRVDNRREVELAAEQGFNLPRREHPPRGVVQDANARFLGGVAGHAGLFAGGYVMMALAKEWLRPSKLLTAAQVESAMAGQGAYGIGWQRPSRDNSSGPALSASAFGHTGFTGGSLWVDPLAERIALLLTHRRSTEVNLRPARHQFHRLVFDW